jgi:murein DD-endopeptidase MepM/ murein hydrolase activator NlpD
MFRTALSEKTASTEKGAAKPKAEPKAETKSESGGNEEDNEDFGLPDANAVFEPPMTKTITGSGVEAMIAKCGKNLAYFDLLIKRYCLPNTKHTAFRQCGMWDRESDMCEIDCAHTKISSAGAKGSFQFEPDTFRQVGVDGDRDGRVDMNNFYDNAESSVRYICALEKKHGEDMYRAYNGGGAGYQTKPATIGYDRYVRERADMYQARIAGSGLSPEQMAKGVAFPAVGQTLTRADFTFPVPIGECFITSIIGEPRPLHPLVPHQGHDVACPPGTLVRAAYAGRIRFAGKHGGERGERAGVQIQELVGTGIPGTLGAIFYFHLSEVRVKDGQSVNVGDVIGVLGARGDGKSGIQNSGAHLHWEVFLWGAGRNLTEHDNPCQWVDCSGVTPGGSFYKGPQNERSRQAAEHLLSFSKRGR